MSVSVPSVAIVGRSNVGKSTIFNRVLEQQKALISAIPGTTRDRITGLCVWRGQVISFIDTGGVDIDDPDEIETEIIRQSELAREEADIILFVVEAGVPLQDFDKKLATQISKLGKPFFIVANKADTREAKEAAYQHYNWSFEQPERISALRGSGIGDLLDRFYDKLNELNRPPADIIDVQATRVTVVGKPNVGKSTLLNSIMGEERFIASPIEHTTREANDVDVEHDGRTYTFIDTAGRRKKANVRKGDRLEVASVRRALVATKRSDVTLFVIEAKTIIQNQEKVLAGEISKTNAGAIIVVNKWDLIEDKETNTMRDYSLKIKEQFPSLKYAPIIFVSALHGRRTDKLFDMIDEVQKQRYRQIDQADIDDFLARAMRRHKPVKGMGTAPPKILGMLQVQIAPPRFALAIKARRIKKLHPSYLRYLENRMREHFAFFGTPVTIHVKAVSTGTNIHA